MKTINILKIVLLLILISILLSILILFINKDFNFNFKDQTTLVYDKNIDENFDKININSNSLDVKFIKSDDDVINVKVYDNKKNKTTVNVENNTLNIISNNKNNCVFCFVERKEAIITLPNRLYDLNVDTTSGDIISDIDFNNVTIKSTSGDITLNKLKISNITITSGDILINEIDNLTITSTSGNVKINKINEYLNIETQSGDISIKDLSLTNDSKIKVTSGDITILKSSNDIYYNPITTSGDVLINNNNRFAQITLDIKTTSGNIKVN